MEIRLERTPEMPTTSSPAPLPVTAPPEAADVRRATLQMLAVALIWGAFWVSGKWAVAEAGPMAVASLRFWFASVGFVILYRVREQRTAPRLTRQDWLLAFALGATGVAGYNALCFLGLHYAPASDGAMLTPSLNPVLTGLVAAWLLNETLTRNRLIGQGLAIAGVALIFAGPILTAQATGDRGLGDVLFILAAVVWSAYTLLGKVAVGRFTPLTSSMYASVFGALLLLPFSWRELAAVNWGGLTWQFWANMGFISLISTVAAFLMWNDAIARVGASRTATFNLLVPIFGVVCSALLLGERPGPWQVVGMGLAILGVYWASRRHP